ncbi:TRAP transporter large permease [Oceanicella actignis]|uniref:TRAP transporter, DctM subunit n=1 Tax=Oceanicella actignis TaxID=1189325 RepID=A0A1M7SSS5_9RHOB|nr:TRAP transporter large permease [Oceanicella actignis]TYO90734.1 tripartite ATP-independent transporter DctM subunit [Oceanicella actignis]SES69245.1 TRAP transporter, DctM subunit [Oceanicella actignis]SHN61539.1 TRAP transporter, DctM subunit [Oceanicella actignis]
MTTIETSFLLAGLLILLVVIGVRVAFATALIGFIGLFTVFAFDKGQGWERGLTTAVRIAGQVPHSKTSTHVLGLIPTFILIGYLAYYAGLTKALFEAAKRWVGWLPGGLGVATVFATAGFAAVSGASVATSAVFARIAIPEMLKLGYDKRFAAGVVAAGGTLASLIPPSAILVIYAIITESSVGQLLLAGFLPGAVSAVIYGGLVITLAKTRKHLGPPVTGFTWAERFQTLPGAFPIMFVVAIIIFCIYGGWGTPTEAGALGAFVVLVMALWRGMRWSQLRGALMESAKLTVMIFTMIWGVLIYVRYLGFADLPGAFASWVAGLEQPPMLTLLLILSAYVVLGMFMDAIGMLILTLPVTFPAVIALNGGMGVSAADSALGMTGPECAVWFGIIVVKMAELCLITPPIGLNCFVVAGVRPDISVQDVFRGASPFFIADVLTVAVLIAFPGIVLWLPAQLGG